MIHCSKLITTLRPGYRQHRARRVAQHAFRRTAAQIVEQPVVARRCHDDEIGADLLRDLEDGFDDRPPSQIDVRQEIAEGWQRLADMNHVKLRYRLQHAHHVGGQASGVHRGDFRGDRHQHVGESDLACVLIDEALLAVPQEQRRRMGEPRCRLG